MEENQQATARENIMGTMNINPLLVKLSVPMMVSMLVQALYNVVDSIFVSHVSESALTAVSLAFSLQNVMIAVGVGTGVGVNALLSKSLGEKNPGAGQHDRRERHFSGPVQLCDLFVIGLTCMKPYFYAQTSDPDIARQGIRYLRVCSVSALACFFADHGREAAGRHRPHQPQHDQPAHRRGGQHRAGPHLHLWLLRRGVVRHHGGRGGYRHRPVLRRAAMPSSST